MRRNLNATPQFIGALTELVWTQIGTFPLVGTTTTAIITIIIIVMSFTTVLILRRLRAYIHVAENEMCDEKRERGGGERECDRCRERLSERQEGRGALADPGNHGRKRRRRPRELLPPRRPLHRHHRRRAAPRAQEPGPAAAHGRVRRPAQGRQRQRRWRSNGQSLCCSRRTRTRTRRRRRRRRGERKGQGEGEGRVTRAWASRGWLKGMDDDENGCWGSGRGEREGRERETEKKERRAVAALARDWQQPPPSLSHW